MTKAKRERAERERAERERAERERAEREWAKRERAERERAERERAERERAEQMQHSPNDKVMNEAWSPRYHVNRVARGAACGAGSMLLALSKVPPSLLQSTVHSMATLGMDGMTYGAHFGPLATHEGGGRKKKKSHKHTTHQSWSTYRSPKTQTRKKHNQSPAPIELFDFARDARPENNPPLSKPIKPGSRAAHARDLAHAQTARDREECRQTDEINRDWQLTDARWLADLQRRQQRRRRKEEKQRDQMRKSKVKSAAHLATVRKTKSIKKSASGTKHRRRQRTRRRTHRRKQRRRRTHRHRRRKPTQRAKRRRTHRRHR